MAKRYGYYSRQPSVFGGFARANEADLGGTPGIGGGDVPWTPPPTDPTVPPPGGGGGGGGGGGNPHSPIHIRGNHPNYGALANSDADYQYYLSNLLPAQRNLLTQRRRDAIRNAIIQWGVVPSGVAAADQYGDIDASTAASAQNLTSQGLSTSAQLSHAHARALELLRAQMAGRGILSSGETGYQTQEEGLHHAGQVNEAINQLLGIVSGASGDYASGYNATEQERVNQLQGAAGRATANNPTTADVDAVWDADHGLYKDPYGNLYDQNGKLVHAVGTY